MTEPTSLLAALLVGLMSSSHCLAMCGGIGATLGAASGRPQPLLALAYNLGRVACYALLGLIAGALVLGLGALLQDQLPLLGRGLRSLAALLVIAMGLYVAGWWYGLTRLERLGSGLWRRLQPQVSRLLPARTPAAALALGALWGLLPCGLVYSSLSWAATSGEPLRAALLMGAFGLGTLPAMWATTLGGQQLAHRLRRPWVRRLAGALLVLFGLYTLAHVWLPSPGHAHVDAPTLAPALQDHAHH